MSYGFHPIFIEASDSKRKKNSENPDLIFLSAAARPPVRHARPHRTDFVTKRRNHKEGGGHSISASYYRFSDENLDEISKEVKDSGSKK